MAGQAFAWHDKTHLAISQAAGHENWYNTAGPDMAKTKVGNKEGTNHWCNNSSGKKVTEKIVWDQVNCYDDPEDKDGHLYGAIIHSLQHYLNAKAKNKYAGYHLAFCAHYIGDLSMPLHHIPFGEDKLNNRDHHTRNDGTVENNVLENVKLIRENIYEITIQSEQDLAREIVRIANISRELASKLENEGKRDLKRVEAYEQLYHSASLLKAVLAYAEGVH